MPDDPYPPTKDNTVRNVLLTLTAIVSLSFCYYFLVVLPRESRARLEFDQLKYEEEKTAKQVAKDEAEKAKSDNFMAVAACEEEAETTYWSYIKLNQISSRPGEKKGETIYVAPQHIWERAASEKKDHLAECHRDNK